MFVCLLVLFVCLFVLFVLFCFVCSFICLLVFFVCLFVCCCPSSCLSFIIYLLNILMFDSICFLCMWGVAGSAWTRVIFIFRLGSDPRLSFF